MQAPLSITVNNGNKIVFLGDRGELYDYRVDRIGAPVVVYNTISDKYRFLNDIIYCKNHCVFKNYRATNDTQEEYILFNRNTIISYKYKHYENSNSIKELSFNYQSDDDGVKFPADDVLCVSLPHTNRMLYLLIVLHYQLTKHKIGLLHFQFVCIDLIMCKGGCVSVFEYMVVNDILHLKHKQTLDFQRENVKGSHYDNDDSGMCVLGYVSENTNDHDTYIDSEFKSDRLVDDIQKAYNILIFGNQHHDFVSSLKWLSLRIVNNNNVISYNISIDIERTKQFQQTYLDIDRQILPTSTYYSFGYTKWKHYLILFGGFVPRVGEIDSIFYFDLLEMKWHKSITVS